MKRVILMRHAKSSWDHPGLSDHERPLNGRGKRDAPEMAQRLKDEGLIPQMIYSSDSQRTQDTYAGLSSILGHIPVDFSRDLYHASPNQILKAVQNADDKHDSIMILAHNPGITYAFETLGKVHVDNVPTSGIGVFEYEVESFKEIEPETGRMICFPTLRRSSIRKWCFVPIDGDADDLIASFIAIRVKVG